MLFVLTLIAFCTAAAYISAPFWPRRSTPAAIVGDVVEVADTSRERRRRVEAEAEIEIMIARTRRRTQSAGIQASVPVQSWQCAKCARQMGQEDRFCASCGTARPQ